MQTATLVQASAEIVTIVTLRPGDVYKRLVETPYSTDKWAAYYGVVQTVDSNGEDAMVTSIELVDGAAKTKVFGTNVDVKLFAATPAEVELAFQEAVKTADDAVDLAARSLKEKQASRAAIGKVQSGAKSLSAPVTSIGR